MWENVSVLGSRLSALPVAASAYAIPPSSSVGASVSHASVLDPFAVVPYVVVLSAPDRATSREDALDIPLSDLFTVFGQGGVPGFVVGGKFSPSLRRLRRTQAMSSRLVGPVGQ